MADSKQVIPSKAAEIVTTQSKRLSQRFAEKYGVDSSTLMQSLKDTAFRQKEGAIITDSQMVALLIVSDQLNLNPFAKEIYAFPSQRGIVPIIPIDGYLKIMNNHPQFDGMDLNYSEEMIEIEGSKPCHEWIECVIKRKDRTSPIIVREYFDECFKKTDPWSNWPKRMLRHKAIMQDIRIAFGLAGVYDEDEGNQIKEAEFLEVITSKSKPRVSMPVERTQPTDAHIENKAEPKSPENPPDQPKEYKVKDERQYS